MLPTLTDRLLPTMVIGSYPQPDWLIDRDALRGRFPPRVRARELWRVDPQFLAEAQDDATVLALHHMAQAGLDIVTDGEMRRESYSNHFATALEGVDIDDPGTALDRSGHPNPVPRIVGRVARREPVNVGDLQFAQRHTDQVLSITVPGPFTMSQQAQDDYYGDDHALALDYAAAVNAELRDLERAGADVVQIDEPYLQPRVQAAQHHAIDVIDRAFEGITVPKSLHTCFGYAQIIHDKPSSYPFLAPLNDCAADVIALETAQPGLDLARLAEVKDKIVAVGVLDLDDPSVEPPEAVAHRLRGALAHLAPEQVVAAPDCGMKYLPRDVAQAKLASLVEGAAIVRSELARASG